MPKPSLRDAILDAGFEQLHEGGYTATGVAAIAAAAHAPKGSFYNHFRSKEALAVEILQRYGRSRRLEMLSEPGVGALQRIRNHLVHLDSDLAAHDYQWGCMFGNFAAENPAGASGASAVVAAALSAWRGALADAIRDGQTTGEIDSGLDADQAAGYVVDAWEGAALRAKSVGGGAPVNNVVEFTFSRVLAPPAADLSVV